MLGPALALLLKTAIPNKGSITYGQGKDGCDLSLKYNITEYAALETLKNYVV
jgi:hypothetical protein